MKRLGIMRLPLSSFLKEAVYNPNKLLRFKLPNLYIKLITVGFVLIGLYYSGFKELEFCLEIFGSYCDPVGTYLFTLASFPGYIIISQLAKGNQDLTQKALLLIVISFSLLCYYFLGLILEKLKARKTNIVSVPNIVIAVFILLLIMVLVLSL